MIKHCQHYTTETESQNVSPVYLRNLPLHNFEDCIEHYIAPPLAIFSEYQLGMIAEAFAAFIPTAPGVLDASGERNKHPFNARNAQFFGEGMKMSDTSCLPYPGSTNEEKNARRLPLETLGDQSTKASSNASSITAVLLDYSTVQGSQSVNQLGSHQDLIRPGFQRFAIPGMNFLNYTYQMLLKYIRLSPVSLLSYQLER